MEALTIGYHISHRLVFYANGLICERCRHTMNWTFPRNAEYRFLSPCPAGSSGLEPGLVASLIFSDQLLRLVRPPGYYRATSMVDDGIVSDDPFPAEYRP